MNSDELISKCCGEISYKIGSDWSRWGRHLGLVDADLENIDFDHQKDFNKADNVLKKWKQKKGYFSWDQLRKELIDFNRNDIVVEIEEIFKGDLSSLNNLRNETLNFDLSEQSRYSKKSKNDLSMVSAELKKFYLKYFGKISEFQPLLKSPTNVDLMHKFIDLCIVDAVELQMDTVFSVERKEFLEKQMRYTPVPYSDLFMNEKSAILISGIAGIGKTWLLRKCLLDWSNKLIWKNVELVFYLECRKINQYQNVSNINELLNVFYKDVINNFNICYHNALFIIDGLDEFKYFYELLNPSLSFYYPIVGVLAEIQKYKHLAAGRVYAINQYQSMYTDHSDKLIIQIMGFNENGIRNYVENHVMEENKEIIKVTLKGSPIANAMASVPFYLSSMCKIIKKRKSTSFLTMTDLYANIFLYFLQKHIIKNNKMIYQTMENDFNKKYILNICKIAYKLFIENKVIFSKEEIKTFIDNFDENEDNFFGFIEKIETDLGCYYQFAHLTIMEFCASVYAYNCLSCDEILGNKKLESCLSMICGLTNKSQNTLLKFLVNLNPSKKFYEESSLLYSILDRLSKSINSNPDDFNLFYECFYESQSSFTDKIISIVDEQNKQWFQRFGWMIRIDDGKTSYATSCDNYFVDYYIKSGRMLKWLYVDKKILSDEEKKLLIRCSTNVRFVNFLRPINFKGWKPKDKIELLDIHISGYLITKKDFEKNFLPWINLCEILELKLHYDIDFFKDICKWIRCSNIKKFEIKYGGNYFNNLDELSF